MFFTSFFFNSYGFSTSAVWMKPTLHQTYPNMPIRQSTAYSRCIFHMVQPAAPASQTPVWTPSCNQCASSVILPYLTITFQLKHRVNFVFQHFPDTFRVRIWWQLVKIMLESQLIHLNQIEFLIATYRLKIVTSLIRHLQLCVLLVLQLLHNKFLHRQQQTQSLFFLSLKQVLPVVNLHRRVRVFAQKL